MMQNPIIIEFDKNRTITSEQDLEIAILLNYMFSLVNWEIFCYLI